jgi:hypothetical protein
MAPREIGTGTRAKADEEDLKAAERGSLARSAMQAEV